LNCHLNANLNIVWSVPKRCPDERILDSFMRVTLRSHHEEVPPNQFDSFTLSNHPDLDHATDVLDRECTARGKIFDLAGNRDIHVGDRTPVSI
jgi:hypothetical protein